MSNFYPEASGVKKATAERLVALGTMFIRLSRPLAAHDNNTQNDCKQDSCHDPYNNGAFHGFFLDSRLVDTVSGAI